MKDIRFAEILVDGSYPLFGSSFSNGPRKVWITIWTVGEDLGVILFKEMKNNPGMSVTNSAEKLIGWATGHFDYHLHGRKKRWFECYEGREEEIDEIFCPFTDTGPENGGCYWKHTPLEEFRSLVMSKEQLERELLKLELEPDRMEDRP